MLFWADEAESLHMLSFASKSSPGNRGVPAKIQTSDLLAVGIIGAIALALRAWKLTSLGLTHYDEGANALSGFWSLPSFSSLYPWQKFFAPPGYFGLVGIIYWLAGRASDLAAIGVNVFFGAATTVLVWWIGQRWFGRRAAIFSATLVALSEFQIALSRTALTDALFSFVFLLSLAAIAHCFEKERRALAIVAGVTVGAAWNVKYHGWLLLAIAFAAVVLPAAIAKRADPIRAKKIFLYWGAIAVVAVICFLPWLLYTEFRLGGYVSVEKFHRQYLNFHWIANLIRQAEMQNYFDGWLSRASPAIAFLAAAMMGGIRHFLRTRILVACLIVMVVAGFVVGGTGAWLLFALYGLVITWRRGQELDLLLAITFVVFLVLTPCYTPFARLLLPWVLVAQVLAGAAIEHLCEEEIPAANPSGSLWQSVSLRFLATVIVLLLILVAVVGIRAPRKPGVWEATTGSRDAAARLMPYLSKDSVVFVTGEPNVAFYFQRADYRTFCIQHLAFNVGAQDPLMYETSSPVYVIGGKYAREESDWLPILNALPGRFQLVARVAMQPSTVRLLDDKSPREALEFKAHPDSSYDLELFRLNYPPKR